MHSKSIHAVTGRNFKALVADFVDVRAQALKQGAWLDNIKPAPHVLHPDQRTFSVSGPEEKSSHYTPFIEKILVPEGTYLVIVGDIHGDSAALTALLAHLQAAGYYNQHTGMVRNDVRLIFLGDYINRGRSSIAVVSCLLRLYCDNPERVVLLRGNHESVHGNKSFHRAVDEGRRGYEDKASFWGDLASHIPDSDPHETLLWYDYLPMTVFVGVQRKGHTDYLHCTHGGLELGFCPAPFLADRSLTHALIMHLDRAGEIERFADKQYVRRIKNDLLTARAHTTDASLATFIDSYSAAEPVQLYSGDTPISSRLGYLWNLFLPEEQADLTCAVSLSRRSLYYGKQLTEQLLMHASGPTHTIHAIIRGHQHMDEELPYYPLTIPFLTAIRACKGLIRQWRGQVNTLGCSSSISTYQSWVMLHCQDTVQRWPVRHYYKAPDATEFSCNITPLLQVPSNQEAG